MMSIASQLTGTETSKPTRDSRYAAKCVAESNASMDGSVMVSS